MINKVAEKKISDYLNQNKQSLDEINQHLYGHHNQPANQFRSRSIIYRSHASSVVFRTQREAIGQSWNTGWTTQSRAYN